MFLIDQQGNSCTAGSRVTAPANEDRSEGDGEGEDGEDGGVSARQERSKPLNLILQTVKKRFEPRCNYRFQLNRRLSGGVGGSARVSNLDQTDINRFILNEQTFSTILMKSEQRSAAARLEWWRKAAGLPEKH